MKKKRENEQMKGIMKMIRQYQMSWIIMKIVNTASEGDTNLISADVTSVYCVKLWTTGAAPATGLW